MEAPELCHSPEVTVPAGYTGSVTNLHSFSCTFLYFKADFYFHVHQFPAVSGFWEPCSPRGTASLQIYGWLCVSEKLLDGVKRAVLGHSFGCKDFMAGELNNEESLPWEGFSLVTAAAPSLFYTCFCSPTDPPLPGRWSLSCF